MLIHMNAKIMQLRMHNVNKIILIASLILIDMNVCVYAGNLQYKPLNLHLIKFGTDILLMLKMCTSEPFFIQILI